MEFPVDAGGGSNPWLQTLCCRGEQEGGEGLLYGDLGGTRKGGTKKSPGEFLWQKKEEKGETHQMARDVGKAIKSH